MCTGYNRITGYKTKKIREKRGQFLLRDVKVFIMGNLNSRIGSVMIPRTSERKFNNNFFNEKDHRTFFIYLFI